MQEDEPTPEPQEPPGTPDNAPAEPTPAPAGSTAVDPAAAEARRRRRGFALVAAVFGPILVIALLAAGYVQYLDHLVARNVHHEALLPTESGPERLSSAGAAENYLFIGVDRREGESGIGRSDVIMWVHVDQAHRRVDLVHVPRDYFVEIPGHGTSKINAAYEAGGAPLLVSTLQSLFKTKVDHVAVVDFEGFEKMTDSVGGVDIDVPAEVASKQFPRGQHHLDGAQSLTFVRERKGLAQQDISRGKRQQLYLESLLLKALSDDVLLDPVTFAKFVDAATQRLTLDHTFPKDQLRDKAFEMRGVKRDAVFFWSAPWTGVGTQGAAGSVVYPNVGLLEELGDRLASDDMSGYRDDETPTTGFLQTPEQAARTQARARTATTAVPSHAPAVVTSTAPESVEVTGPVAATTGR